MFETHIGVVFHDLSLCLVRCFGSVKETCTTAFDGELQVQPASLKPGRLILVGARLGLVYRFGCYPSLAI